MGRPGLEQRLSERSWSAVAVVGLLALAMATRLWGIEIESLWTDEAYSARVSSSLGAAVGNVCDGTPPLYDAGLALWRQLWPATELGLRSYSLVWSLVGLLLLYRLTCDTSGRIAGLLALFLGALNPLDIYYGQEARMYAQAVALVVLCSWCLWRWLVGGDRQARGSAVWLLAYAVAAAALLLTHYATVAVLLAQGLFALVHLGRRGARSRALHYLLAAALAVLMVLPWLLLVQTRCGSLYPASRVGWIPAVPVWQIFDFLANEFFWGPGQQAAELAWLLSAPLALAVILLALVSRPRGPVVLEGESQLAASVYLSWLLFGPVLIVALLSALYHPVYYPMRFSLFVLPAFLALTGRVISERRRAALNMVLLVAIVAVTSYGSVIQRLTLQKSDWRLFAEVWRQGGRPEPVLVLPRFTSVAAEHYMQSAIGERSAGWLEKLTPFLQGREVWVAMPRWGGDPSPSSYDDEVAAVLAALGEPELAEPPRGVKLLIYRSRGLAPPMGSGERFARWYSPLNLPGQLSGLADRELFADVVIMEDSTPVRWASPRAHFVLGRTAPGERVVLGLEARREPAVGEVRFHLARLATVAEGGLFASSPAKVLSEAAPGPLEVTLDLPAGSGPVAIGWDIRDAAAESPREGTRPLGIRWIAIERAAALAPAQSR